MTKFGAWRWQKRRFGVANRRIVGVERRGEEDVRSTRDYRGRYQDAIRSIRSLYQELDANEVGGRRLR